MFGLSKFRAKFITFQERELEYIVRCLFFKKRISKQDLKVLNLKVLNNGYFYNEKYCDLIKTRISRKTGYKCKNLISVQGFLHTGSSAVIDLLREFDNNTVFGISEPYSSGFVNNEPSYDIYMQEFWLYNHMAIFELEKYIGANMIGDEDFVIKRIIKTIDGYRNMFLVNFALDLYDLFDKYILPMIDTGCNNFACIKQQLHQWNHFASPRGGYAIGKMNYTHEHFRLKQGITIDIFRDNCKLFFDSVIGCIGESDNLIIDQLVDCELGYDTELHNKYLGNNFKHISVYRDPRDQFMQLIYFSTRCPEFFTWYHKFLYPSINFIDSYKGGVFPISPKKYFENSHPNRLMIRFEDLINDYENSITTICDFLGIDKSHHINKGKYFIPEVSRKNIGIYKNYHDQRVMDKIKEELGEYCYE